MSPLKRISNLETVGGGEGERERQKKKVSPFPEEAPLPSTLSFSPFLLLFLHSHFSLLFTITCDLLRKGGRDEGKLSTSSHVDILREKFCFILLPPWAKYWEHCHAKSRKQILMLTITHSFTESEVRKFMKREISWKKNHILYWFLVEKGPYFIDLLN